MLHRIDVISDTHIPQFKQLPEAVWTHFAEVELIIHAGDLSRLQVINELETLVPVIARRGSRARTAHQIGAFWERAQDKHSTYPGQCTKQSEHRTPGISYHAAWFSDTATSLTIRNTTGNYSLIPAARLAVATSQPVVSASTPLTISLSRYG